MSHPYQSSRENHVQRGRVAKLTAGYSKEPGISKAGASESHRIAKTKASGDMPKIDGGSSKPRLDKYARGGAVKKGATNVNVIIAPQGGQPANSPPPVLPAPGGMGPPPPVPPGIPPPGGPPPMMQNRGGRTHYASGGKVADGPAWKEGLRNGTQVQHSDGKSDLGDIYRPKQITYAAGGPVEASNSRGPKLPGGDNGEGRLAKAALQKRAG